MNYIVYKTTNLINGKIYIGVHKMDINKPDTYIGCGICKKDQKKKINIGFPAAVHKYGYENFKREILFVFDCTEDGRQQAYAKEAELVTPEFVKLDTNYNLIPGGAAPLARCETIAQYTLDGELIKIWPSITEAEQSLGMSSISACVLGISKYAGNYQWKKFTGNMENIPPVETRERTVYQFDLSGNLIKVWKHSQLAAEQFKNKKAARSAINQVCNGKRVSAYGYFWSYKRKFTYKPYKADIQAVAKYSLNGDFIESFENVYEAANNVGTNHGNIYQCINGYHKQCKGFRWRYFYGNTSSLSPL